jgi:hypothetical protein
MPVPEQALNGSGHSEPVTDHGDHAEIVAARFMQGLRYGTAVITLVLLYGLELPKLLSSWDSYRSPLVQVLSMAVFTAVALVAWRDEVVKRWRWVLILIVLVAAVAAAWTVAPADRLGLPHWSDEAVGWPLVLLSLDRRMGFFISLLVAQYIPSFLLVALDGPVDATFAGMVNSTTITAAFQIAVVLFANALRRVAMSVVRVAREEEKVRTGEAVADQLHSDRKDRYAGLAETTAPLLAGLGSGALDPGDETVRRACAIEAARMRRLFGETTAGPDPLVDELMACVGLAERNNGVSVRFSERGERPPVPTAVRRMLTEPAVAVLATARGDVRLTVVGADDNVTVSVVANVADIDVPTVNNDEITTSTVLTGDRVWVQATWKGHT